MYLSSCGLAYKAACRGRRATITRQTQAFDMAVGCGSGFARVALDFADRDRGHFRGRRCPIDLLCDVAAPRFACKSVGAMMGQFVNARVGVFGCLELEVWESRGSRKTSVSARAHLSNRPPSRPHLRFAHEYHGTQLATPLLLACALSRMRRLSPVISHGCKCRGSYFGPSRLPLPRSPPPNAVTGRGLLRRCQQSVQCFRSAHCSYVANFYPGLVRYQIRGSFPAVALSARLYPPAPEPRLHPRDSRRRKSVYSSTPPLPGMQEQGTGAY
jgi:hypothetical protein